MGQEVLDEQVARVDHASGGFGVALSIFCCGGCVSRGPVSIHSDDPDLKIKAIQRDVRENDKQDLTTMVDDLNSDDPAVRFYSIQALHRLTHDDFGYQFYQDDQERAPFIERWKKWLKSQGK